MDSVVLTGSRWRRTSPISKGIGEDVILFYRLQELNRIDKHRMITVLATMVDGMKISGLSGRSRLKLGARLQLNAKVGDARPLPTGSAPVLDLAYGGIRTVYEVEVNTHIATGVRFGGGCDAVKGLPVVRTLDRMTNEVSRVVESFSGEFE